MSNPSSNSSSGLSGVQDIISVDPHADEVKCDGGGGALGHPTVWYSFYKTDRVRCQYCDRIFTKAAH